MSEAQLGRILQSFDRFDPRQETYNLTGYGDLTEPEQESVYQTLYERAEQQDLTAIMTLAVIKDPRCIPLLRSLTSAADEVARSARRALSRLGHGDEVMKDLTQDSATGRLSQRFAAVDQE